MGGPAPISWGKEVCMWPHPPREGGRENSDSSIFEEHHFYWRCQLKEPKAEVTF